jgi:hypothetical protein
MLCAKQVKLLKKNTQFTVINDEESEKSEESFFIFDDCCDDSCHSIVFSKQGTVRGEFYEVHGIDMMPSISITNWKH